MRIRSEVRSFAPRAAVRTCAVALAVVAGVLLGPLAAVADAAGRFEIQVTAGYDSYARQDDWTPVRIAVKNNGGDFRGVLRVDDASGNTTNNGPTFGGGFKGTMCCGGATSPVGFAARQLDVVVPAHSTRHYTLYVAGAQTPRANLLEGGNTVASGEVGQALNNTSSAVLLVAVVSDQVDTLDHLSLVHLGSGSTLHIVHLKTTDLPASGVLLRSFDSLAFDDASTDSLTGDQRAALRDYVAGGGGLLLVGGPNAQKTLAGIPAELQPVRTSATARDDLRAVAGLASSPAPAGGAEVSTGTPVKGAMAISDGAVPVLAWLRFGAGSVVYTAFDAGAEPISSWPGERSLLRQLVNRATSARPADAKGGTQPVTSGRPGLDYGSISSVLTNLPSLDVPSIGLVAWLLLAYAFIIGPTNYLVLKRIRRRHLAWLTIPAMVAVSSGSVLLVGFNIKGSGTQVNQVRVIQMTASSPRQYVVTYSGVVVAHRGDYTLSLPDGSFFGSAPSASYPQVDGRVVIDGEPPRALLPGMTAYSVRAVAAEGYSTARGQVTIDTHVAGSTLLGTITNNTDRDIEDAFVVYGGGFQQLGILRPGHSQAVSVNISGQFRGTDIASVIYPTYNGPTNTSAQTATDRERQRRAQIVRGLTTNNFNNLSRDPMLIGFQPDGATQPQIDGHAVTVLGENVVVLALPIGADPVATSITGGDVTPRVVDFEGDAQSFPNGVNGSITTRLAGGSATVEFDLPGGGWKTVEVGTGSGSGSSSGSAPCASAQPVPAIIPLPPGGSSGSAVAVPAVGTCVLGQATLSVFNFKTGKWDAISAGAGGRTALDPAAGEVSPDGVVLVRYAVPGGTAAMISGSDITATRKGTL